MRQVYKKHLSHVCSGATDLYLEDERIESGKVLVLRNLTGFFSAQATTEESEFFIRSGANRDFIGEDQPLMTAGAASWQGKLAVGEGDQVGVYLPDIATSEVGHLYIFGELWDLKDWEKANG